MQIKKPQNYKIKFLKTKAKVKKHETIIFVHGLFRSYWSMYLLAYFFRKKGYDIYLFDYPSTKHVLKQHIDDFYHFLDICIKKHPKEKLHIITHSMGGIITRGAMAKLSIERYQHIHSIIMLVPPNQGSPYASKILSWIPKLNTLIKPLADISTLTHAHIHKLKKVHHPNIGIIAAKYDNKVPSKLAQLTTRKQKKPF